jgi:hypothetical protein
VAIIIFKTVFEEECQNFNTRSGSSSNKAVGLKEIFHQDHKSTKDGGGHRQTNQMEQRELIQNT